MDTLYYYKVLKWAKSATIYPLHASDFISQMNAQGYQPELETFRDEHVFH